MRMTTDEIKVVVFILMALLVGTATKHYRLTHPEMPRSTPAAGKRAEKPW